jgi:DNA-binding NarL/FixJ family response regulator
MSSNTIKHYISSILQTLGVKSRKELKPFVNK